MEEGKFYSVDTLKGILSFRTRFALLVLLACLFILHIQPSSLHFSSRIFAGTLTVESDIRPTSNTDFRCSICQIRRPCVSPDGMILIPHHQFPKYHNLAEREECGFRLELDGRIQGFRAYNSTWMPMRGPIEGSERFRNVDILNLSSYSSHLPSFLWVVYVQALFFLRVCGKGTPLAFKKVCNIQHPVVATPEGHTFLPWYATLIPRVQEEFPNMGVIHEMKGQGSENTTSCYRSALFSDCLSMRAPKPNEYFFYGGEHNSSLKPATLKRNSPIRAIVINRKKSRTLANVREVTESISSIFKSRKLDLEIKEVFFEEIPFPKQQVIIGQSDLIVASHGAATSQILLSKPQALVLDILPFGYQFTGFQSYASWSGANYAMSVSEPDYELMSICLRRKKALLEGWMNLTKMSHAEYLEGVPKVSGVYAVRRCTRSQVLKANVKEVVSIVESWFDTLPEDAKL